MRAPGGEDHCGCITLMRFSSESPELCQKMWHVYSPTPWIDDHQGDVDAMTLLSDLARIHQELKHLERGRGVGIHHGTGVMPKSRRILLTVTSCIALNAMHSQQNSNVQKCLLELVGTPLTSILCLSSKSKEEALYHLCEACYDLASFPPTIVRSLLLSGDEFDSQRAIEVIVSFLVDGYSLNFVQSDTGGHATEQVSRLDEYYCYALLWIRFLHAADLTFQWSRLRGAAVTLFRACSNPDMLSIIGTSLSKVISEECKSVTLHYQAVVHQHATVFLEKLVGEEMLPAGAFLMVLAESLERALNQESPQESSFEHIVHSMSCCTTDVLECISSNFSIKDGMGHFVDPRPTIMEAWYLCMEKLVIYCLKKNANDRSFSDSPVVSDIISHSLTCFVSLVQQKQVNRNTKTIKESHDMVEDGLSLDGPQTLALLGFLEISPKIGINVFVQMAQVLQSTRWKPTNVDISPEVLGLAVMCATLFRGLSGALPPWSIESMPGVFASIFNNACNNNVAHFCIVLDHSLDLTIHLDSTINLAGPFVATMSDFTRKEFLGHAKDAGEQNDANGWRRFKTSIKHICGGKKKDTAFSLKPGFTSWDCDRL